ncbi:MAG TPA: hypothetical protein DCR98_04850, partial [Cobetia sp.]|nr:hypothetical protein [Cobetia sp.]
RGAPALSTFRHAKLLAQLRVSVPEIEALHAEYVHFADLERELDATELSLLERLLDYGPAQQDSDVEGLALLVVPRIGTQSPWSSKATDIA